MGKLQLTVVGESQVIVLEPNEELKVKKLRSL